jgi:hypothetical protein
MDIQRWSYTCNARRVGGYIWLQIDNAFVLILLLHILRDIQENFRCLHISWDLSVSHSMHQVSHSELWWYARPGIDASRRNSHILRFRRILKPSQGSRHCNHSSGDSQDVILLLRLDQEVSWSLLTSSREFNARFQNILSDRNRKHIYGSLRHKSANLSKQSLLAITKRHLE